MGWNAPNELAANRGRRDGWNNGGGEQTRVGRLSGQPLVETWRAMGDRKGAKIGRRTNTYDSELRM